MANVHADRKLVAVVGCGAVGLYYGLRLLESELSRGHPLDVNFLTRRDFELISSSGVRFNSSRGNDMLFTSNVLAGKVYKDSADLAAAKGAMDWLVIAVKSYSIDDALRDSLLKIHERGRTRCLVILNGLGVEQPFADWFGGEDVFGGISFVAINRGPNPPLEAGGPLLVSSMHDGMLHVGHFLDDAARLQEVRQLFGASKEMEHMEFRDNLLSARWNKLILNLIFSGLGVALGGVTIDFIVADPSLRVLANRIMDETIAIANADIRQNYQQLHAAGRAAAAAAAAASGDSDVDCPYVLDLEQIRELTWSKATEAGAYKMSAVVDLLEGREVELNALFWPPIRAAERLGFDRRDYTSLSNLVLTVEAMCRMSKQKVDMGVKWTPTFVVGSM